MKVTYGMFFSWRVIKAIAWVTFTEIIRDRILYNIAFFGFLLIALGVLTGQLTSVSPSRVILDFGLTAISLSGAMIAILTGANMLGREFERRTVLVILSRPISRVQFVFGKFIGLAYLLIVNWFLLSVLCVLILALSMRFQEQELSSIVGHTFLYALVLFLFQSLLIGSIAVFFSSISTTSLSVIVTFGLYLIGNNISTLRTLADRLGAMGAGLLNGVATLLPNLENFNIASQATYALPVSLKFVTTSLIYGSLLTVFILLCAGLLSKFKEV